LNTTVSVYAPVELRNEELVVLAEGIGLAEEVAEEVDPAFGEIEQSLGIEILGVRPAGVQTERKAVVLVEHPDVVPGADRQQVGAEGSFLGEDTTHPLTRQFLRVDLAPGGDDRPLGGGRDTDGIPRLDVGLIETREHTMGRVRLELRVEVLGSVLGVDEPVETLAGRVEGALVGDVDTVRRLQCGRRQRDALSVPDRLHLDIVDLEQLDVTTEPLQEGVTAGVIERDGDVTAERLRAAIEIEMEGVVHVRDRFGSHCCLRARQPVMGHVENL
jgi:hypothetical protein